MSKHIVAAISSHGLGHLAQIAPIINAMYRQSLAGQGPTFTLQVRAQLLQDTLKQRIEAPFTCRQSSDDFGMVMHDALRVNLTQSLAAYAKLHQHWSEHTERVANELVSHQAQAVIADTPYLTLAAAKTLGIPSVAICSLNWGDILHDCVAQRPGVLQDVGLSHAQFEKILGQIHDAYAGANLILQPAPAMPSQHLPVKAIDPLMQPPEKADRSGLLTWLAQRNGRDYRAQDVWIVLTSMGGLDLPLNPGNWPRHARGREIIYLMPAAMAGTWPHTAPFALESMSFARMMASCDLVLTKPGYGMFVEATACAKPILYLARPQWPESHYLIKWLDQHNHAIEITDEQIARGQFTSALEGLLGATLGATKRFDGANQAAHAIFEALWSIEH